MSFKRKATDALEDAAKKPKTDSSIMSFFGAPKGSGGQQASYSSSAKSSMGETIMKKFDKKAWVETLNAEQKRLLQLEIDTMNETWLGELKEVLVTPGFLNLKRFLEKEWAGKEPVFPPKNEIYSWSNYTPLNKVKAVIIGQDPYHNHNQAHGLCFSVKPPTPAPPSLVNMYKTLKIDYPSFTAPPNRSGNLIPWAEQGVLLLNTSLTVRAHTAASHSGKGWEQLTHKVIATVAKARKNGVVFLCWGAHAQKQVAGIDKKKHLILNSVHPSPLSAARGFFECGHFKKTNDWLQQKYGVEGKIDWNLTVKSSALPQNSTTNGVPGKAPNPVSATPAVTPAASKATQQVPPKVQPASKPKPATPTVSDEEDLDAGLDDEMLDEAIMLSDKIMPSSPPQSINAVVEEKKEELEQDEPEEKAGDQVVEPEEDKGKESKAETMKVVVQEVEKNLDAAKESIEELKEELQKGSTDKSSVSDAEKKGKENVAVE